MTRARQGEALRTFTEMLAIETDECVIWPFSTNSAGYGQVGHNGTIRMVHAMACEHHHGPRPTPMHDAAHCRPDGTACVARTCMNGQHLSWKTRAENAADTGRHGTQARGAQLSKLAEADVHEIRRLKADGDSSRVVAAKFSITTRAVDDIHRRHRWGWLPDLDVVHELHLPLETAGNENLRSAS